MAKTSEWLDYAGMNAEYRATVKEFPYERAPGWDFPADAAASEPGTKYQVGSGEVAAYFAWLISLERAAVWAHLAGEKAEAQRLIEVAAIFPTTSTFQRYNEPDVPVTWLDAVIVPARAGDFRNLAADAFPGVVAP